MIQKTKKYSLGMGLIEVIQHMMTLIKPNIKEPHKSLFKACTQTYKCKLGSIKSRIKFAEGQFMILQPHTQKQIDFKEITQVKLEPKWWRIQVKIMTKADVYDCNFPTMKNAQNFYEHLIYEKVKLQNA